MCLLYQSAILSLVLPSVTREYSLILLDLLQCISAYLFGFVEGHNTSASLVLIFIPA